MQKRTVAGMRACTWVWVIMMLLTLVTWGIGRSGLGGLELSLLVLGFALTRLMGSLLYGVSATDPAAYVAGCLVLAGVALLASLLPARRAMKLDPVVVLKEE